MGENSFIRLKNVSRSYIIGNKTFKAIDDISVDIDKGEFVVVLGPSGAGKSTLLNLLGAMDSATSGEIIIDGEDIVKYSDSKLTEFRANNVGFIFQFYNILPTLTVFENVEIIKDITKTDKKAEEVLASVGLHEHKDKFPNELSGGEQQRVSIARAVMKNPSLLLCDEPTGALDSNTGVEVLKLLKKQADEGTTVIIVTHNSLIAEMADKLIHLKNGKIDNVYVNPNPKKIEEVVW
ncbi:MAG: ABC transporter ATP-binding protein [Eubacteriales bacterium]|nr:ABC transporter ATP-binding protein [Eubacteriales bacterium]MDY3332638.1 ABC transporter ATP-binding protein [Gallibacter sp.]